MSGLASITLVAGLVLIASPASAGSSAAPEGASAGDAVIDQEVLDALAADGTATFWVHLGERADLSGASSIADRAEQGWFVYAALTATAEASQAGLRAMLDAERVEYQPFWITNTIKVTGDEDLVNRIAARPEVDQILADRVYEIPEPTPSEEQARINAVEWNIDRVNAPQVWSEFGVTGEDIVVANMDTGVQYTHPALVNQYRGNLGNGEFDHNYNWFDPSNICGNPSLEPCDNNNHGTHTMGTIVGDDGGDNQIGVAPGAKWIAAKGCESGSCSTGALLASFQWFLAPTDLQGDNPDPALRPHVVNNSWGNPNGSDVTYRDSVQAWVAAGIFPVFSNGNSGAGGCQTVGAPASYPESYGIGAFDINNNIAGFSSRGPSPIDGGTKPNISAPGVNVRSSIPGGYASFQGTSMAAPHVTGAVALMWSAAVSLQRDIDGTRDLLDTTAIDMEDLTCGGTADNNNVWGEGRLDAFAAVDQSPRGPTGTLSGTVTDAATGDPIPGATITITGPVNRERTTGADGTYTVTLPVGEYTVTATAFGYVTQTAQATITEGQTTTRDFNLETAPSVTITGTVTDGSGHGWPLYATIDVQDTPRNTYTNPRTGQYSLTLPVNTTYTFEVASQYPGYTTTTQTVDVGETDLTVNIALTVNNCEDAPGYDFSGNIAIAGDFENQITDYLDSQGIPTSVYNWGDDPSQYDVIVINRPGNPGEQVFLDFLAATDAAGTGLVFLDTWSTSGNGIWLLWQYLGNPSSRGIGFSSSNPYIYYEVLAEHPILEGFGVGDEIIFAETGDKDHAWFGGYEGEGRQVIANAGRADLGIRGSGIGVQERANNRHALLSMHGTSTFIGPPNWTEAGGQLLVNALEWVAPGASFECSPVPGGLVLGNVTDANTGAGVNGATVTSVDNPAESGPSFATPDDPGLDDGFYWLFSSLTGSHPFTASARNYTDTTQTADVAADAANEANFTLAAGQLTIDPAQVQAEMRLGRSAQRSFTITNTGTAPATVELSERRGDFEILGGGHYEPLGAEVKLIPGEFTPAANPTGGGSTTSTPAQAGPAADPWTDLASYPQNIMDNTAAAVDGVVYSFGGYNGSTRIPNAYKYDPATQEWTAVASMPGERMKPKAAVLDGLVYIVGGWDNASATHSTVFVYDPATDTYSQAADMPAGRTAPGVAVLDGQLYVIGGCTTSGCSPFAQTVWRYDPASDAWETLADYPEQTSWLGCAGLDGQVICAGGVAAASSASTYAYDPAANEWTARADMPYDNWAMAAEAANGQLVVSGGVTNNFATITNQGAAYDPGADTWTAIEPSNNTVYRMGSACGFYKVGGSIGGFSPTTGVEQHPGYTDCEVAGADVPWLTIDPVTATLAPGDSLTVTVTMDSAATEEQQPGAYTAGIGIGHDTPYDVDPVGATMTVTPPLNWGKITGTVTGVDCDGNNTGPLNRAVVQINGRQQQVTLSTGSDGSYAYWLAVNNNPLQILVAAGGHIPQTREASLVPRQTVVEDFTLSRICTAGGGLQQ